MISRLGKKIYYNQNNKSLKEVLQIVEKYY
jgi:hypothetical protein